HWHRSAAEQVRVPAAQYVRGLRSFPSGVALPCVSIIKPVPKMASLWRWKGCLRLKEIPPNFPPEFRDDLSGAHGLSRSRVSGTYGRDRHIDKDRRICLDSNPGKLILRGDDGQTDELRHNVAVGSIVIWRCDEQAHTGALDALCVRRRILR